MGATCFCSSCWEGLICHLKHPNNSPSRPSGPSILLNTQLGSFLAVLPSSLLLPAPAPTTRIDLTHPFPLWEGGSGMSGRWNAASMCLFIVCTIATGCCPGGRARVKGLTQSALLRKAIYSWVSSFGEVRKGVVCWARVLDRKWTPSPASRSTGKSRSTCKHKS